MRVVISALSSSVLCVIASTAFADTPGATPALAEQPEATPAFSLMDNTGDGTKLDAEVSLVTAESANGALVIPRLLGQYVSHSGLGVYGTLAMAGVVGGDRYERATAVGNLEAGVLYHHVFSPRFDVGLRLGVALPTAGYGDALSGLLVTRPADAVQTTPGITWLRFGVSPTFHEGPVFVRVDLGLDVPVDESGARSVMHVNAGVGIGNKQWTATVELQKLFISGRTDDGIEVGGAFLRYHGRISPFVGVSTPLNHGLFGHVATVAIGATVPF